MREREAILGALRPNHYLSVIKEGALKRYEFEGLYGPIIAITGVGGGWHKEVRDYIVANKIRGVLTYFGLLTHGVDKYLPKLQEETNKYPDAVIIGFSTGAFIALRYAQEYGWKNFRKILTIAAPFEGLPKGLGILGRTLKQLSPESNFLKEMLEINPPKGKVLSLSNENDNFITKPYEIREKLNWPCAVLEGENHGSLQDTWQKISPYIEAELGII